MLLRYPPKVPIITGLTPFIDYLCRRLTNQMYVDDWMCEVTHIRFPYCSDLFPTRLQMNFRKQQVSGRQHGVAA